MKITDNKKILIYKLLEIIIFLTFFVWAIALLADNILPGFISNHLSFLKLAIFASIIMIVSSVLGKNLELDFNTKTKKWHLILLAIFSALIISLSLIKFHWIEITTITIISLFIMFYFYKVVFEE